jgi:class 3 adenylate cyclase
MKKLTPLLLLFIFCQSCDFTKDERAETENASADLSLNQDVSIEQAMADSIFNSYIDNPFDDPQSILNSIVHLEKFFLKSKDTCRLARTHSWKCLCYDMLGKLDSSVVSCHIALNYFQPYCDSLTLMSINANLTGTYLSLSETDKVIEIADRNLALWNAQWPTTTAKKGFYTNKAIAQVYQGKLELGLETFKESLRSAREEGNLADEMAAANNISAVFGNLHHNAGAISYLDSSEYYVLLALTIGKNTGRTEDVIIHFLNLATIARDKKKYTSSLAYLDSASANAAGGQFLPLSTDIELVRSKSYRGAGDLDRALNTLHHHIVLKDSLLDSEKLKAISEMQEKYESEKKERQIKELEVVNLNSALREEILTRNRNIYFFAGIGIFLISIGLWSRLRFTKKAKAELQKEKDISEALLLNILPEEIAKELKEKGAAETQLIDQVTVLFTDFKGFTALSEILSPENLVKGINECFSAFDYIMEKHHVEKIKTIGDAYMAAGGLPTAYETHAIEVLRAAIEIQEFMTNHALETKARNEPFFETRIGVHTGSVIAGIVGVKKFQYDIWGDTVNIASRMESSGGVGKVNISESTYEIVREYKEYKFEARGKIETKGKGELEMYFVTKQITMA